MTNTLYQDIQGALETILQGIPGIPEIAFDGVAFTPTVGVPYVVPVLVPVVGRPATMGDDNFKLHEGLFQISVVWPSGQGMGAAAAMADLIKSHFKVETVASHNGTKVRFYYAERQPHFTDTDWVRIPIQISWFIFSSDN